MTVTQSDDAPSRASKSRSGGRRVKSRGRRIVVENGLSIVVMSTFLVTWTLQAVIGMRSYNQDRRDRGVAPVSFGSYLTSGHFIEATGENWESEFLQMAAFVWLTSILFQKGSPESNDPDEPDEGTPPVTQDSPWPARRGGWILKVYENSLSLTFLLLFLISFLLHAHGGAIEYSEDQSEYGQPPVTMIQYMATSRFWFESFQNWQSEFLAIGSMVILGIFLRQKGSPESKSVQTPHWSNE